MTQLHDLIMFLVENAFSVGFIKCNYNVHDYVLSGSQGALSLVSFFNVQSRIDIHFLDKPFSAFRSNEVFK